MGGNPDIFKMTIERKGKKVTLSGSEADVDAFWGLIRSHLSELDGACTNAQSTLAETPKEPLPSAQAVHTAPSICRAHCSQHMRCRTGQTRTEAPTQYGKGAGV